jgi:hypothetical protein
MRRLVQLAVMIGVLGASSAWADFRVVGQSVVGVTTVRELRVGTYGRSLYVLFGDNPAEACAEIRGGRVVEGWVQAFPDNGTGDRAPGYAMALLIQAQMTGGLVRASLARVGNGACTLTSVQTCHDPANCEN